MQHPSSAAELQCLPARRINHLHGHLMKTTFLLPTVLALCIAASTGHAQGTAFTYQGQLIEAGNLATGIYDFRFAVYGAATGGPSVSGAPTNAIGVPVTNGVFTVRLDFGSVVFTGAERW